MKNIKYIFMVLIGGIMYGTMSSVVKLLYLKGFNAAELSFWQAGLAALFLAGCTVASRNLHTGRLFYKDFLPLLLTGSAIGLTNFLYYQSIDYLPASFAIVILMQFTWFSLLLEWIVFFKRPSRIELLTVFFILIGTVLSGNLLAVKEWTFSLKGTLLALLSSLTYAVYIIANGRVCKGVRWQAKSMFIMMGSALSIFLINSHTILYHHHFGKEFLLWALALAVVGTTIPTALFAGGISKIGAGISSILMTVELPVAVLCANLVLGEKITPLQIAGIILMLAAICAMNYYRYLKSRR